MNNIKNIISFSKIYIKRVLYKNKRGSSLYKVKSTVFNPISVKKKKKKRKKKKGKQRVYQRVIWNIQKV